MGTLTTQLGPLRVALSHDWLTGMRGGERVLEILCREFPDAPIHTLIHNPAAISESIRRHPIHTSWLQSIPGITLRYRHFLPLFPLAVASQRLGPADLLISTSHCVAKAVRTRPGTRHLCYCFTPMRYAWTFRKEYLGRNPVKRLAAAPLLKALQIWDRRTARRVDRFVGISRHVQKRIQDFYGRESDLVYPPVDTLRITPGKTGTAPGRFDLVVSALVPYKCVDLAVRAYARSGFPLKIVGTGTERGKLQSAATANIEFLGWQSDADVLELYRACRMLVFPGEEDFGIVPLEAQACGKPVVAYARGGCLETVQPGVSGMMFEHQTEDSLLEAVERCATHAWDPAAIRANAERFSEAHFVAGLANSIAACLRG